MSEDLYTRILGLPPDGERPPDFYALLGIERFEDNVEAIHQAGLAQTAKLKKWDVHPEPAVRDRVQVILNEVGAACTVLEDDAKRAAYDRELALREESGPASPGMVSGEARGRRQGTYSRYAFDAASEGDRNAWVTALTVLYFGLALASAAFLLVWALFGGAGAAR